jgi:hypothetical protein
MHKITAILLATLCVVGMTTAKTYAWPMVAPPPTSYGFEFDHGGYGAMGLKAATMDGEKRYLVGGRGGWIINHTFMLGMAGYGMVGPAMERNIEGEVRKYGMGYGGIDLGVTLPIPSPLTFSLHYIAGIGGVGYTVDTDGEDGDFDHLDWDSSGDTDWFFIGEPQINAEMAVTPFMRICLGAGYRYISGVNEERIGIDAEALSGPHTEIMVKFGYF